MFRGRTQAPLAARRFPPLRVRVLALAVVGWFVGGVTHAATGPVDFTIGVANQVVAGAWNPVRVVTRDLPHSTLTMVIDVGTLKDGEVPVVITHELRGGGGVNQFETDLYVPPFRSLTWRVATNSRVVASGSLGSRESDSRPLVLVVSERMSVGQDGAILAAWPGARLVEVVPSDLPFTPAAYGGVSAVVVAHQAAPVEALVAAAVAGARVVVAGAAGQVPPGLRDLMGETGTTSLGAGLVTSTFPTGVEGDDLIAPRPSELLAPVLAQPLVEGPKPTPLSVVLAGSVAYAVLLLALLRFGGAQGLLSSILVVGLVGVGAWLAVRPAAAQYQGSIAVGVVGGALALIQEAQETLTLPPAALEFGAGASAVKQQPYTADDNGIRLPTAAWRSALVRLPPRAVSAPFTVHGSVISNRSARPLQGTYVIGLGAQNDVAPSGTAALAPGELDAYPQHLAAIYAGLTTLLPAGTLITSSGCGAQSGCVIWLAATELDSGLTGVALTGVAGR